MMRWDYEIKQVENVNKGLVLLSGRSWIGLD
jgi:hypothetical protein